MLIVKNFKFDAAHNLVKYHGKCEKLHGHTYKLVVILSGYPDKEGMVIDFSEIKRIVKDKVLKQLDHSYINDTIVQPTAENISIWVWSKLEDDFKKKNCNLYEIQVWETENNGAVYKGGLR